VISDDRFFARPQQDLLGLSVEPVLASWDVGEAPSQRRLGRFLGHALHMLGPRIAHLDEGPAVLALHIGLPDRADWLEHHDLDNYAFPLTMHVQRHMGRQLDCVWVTKGKGTGSGIAVMTAVPCDPPTGLASARVRTHGSAESKSFKEQIRHAVADFPPLRDGPVGLELSFTVGPSRNWPNLWKPTIDALDPLLGSDGTVHWHPRDGRITELGLHRRVDTSMGHDVDIAVVARSTPAE
jgi:hypothetical protein